MRPDEHYDQFRYDGQYQDDESGLYYLRARYYNPTTGQFITRDPLEAQTSQPYEYANDNPLAFGDPTGLFCVLGHNSDGSCRGSGTLDSVDNTLSSGATWVVDHPGTVGLALGGVALAATGVGAVADAGLIAGEAAEGISATAGAVGVFTGGAATLTDVVPCIESHTAADCAAAGAGIVATGLGVGALFPDLEKFEKVGFGAASFALGAGLLAWDAGRLAADCLDGDS